MDKEERREFVNKQREKNNNEAQKLNAAAENKENEVELMQKNARNMKNEAIRLRRQAENLEAKAQNYVTIRDDCSLSYIAYIMPYPVCFEGKDILVARNERSWFRSVRLDDLENIPWLDKAAAWLIKDSLNLPGIIDVQLFKEDPHTIKFYKAPLFSLQTIGDGLNRIFADLDFEVPEYKPANSDSYEGERIGRHIGVRKCRNETIFDSDHIISQEAAEYVHREDMDHRNPGSIRMKNVGENILKRIFYAYADLEWIGISAYNLIISPDANVSIEEIAKILEYEIEIDIQSKINQQT